MSGEDTIPPREIELKLLFAHQARALLDRHLAATSGDGGHRTHLVTTYYDSPDLSLWHSGLSLRIRRAGRQRIQTLKAVDEGNQLALDRREWEWVVKSDQPDLSVLAGTPFGPQVTAMQEKLAPVWVSDVHRTTYMVHHDGAMVAVAIDEGCVRAGDACAMVRELELEIRDGPARSLYGLALALQAVVPLRLGVLAKAERGYHLLTGAPAAAVRGGTPVLDGNMTLADGFSTLIRSGLGTLIRNQPAAGAGDPEGIHQMRVAIRQLRTMLQMIASGESDHSVINLFQSELRRIGRGLGEARDWDVLCLETLPAAFSTHGDNDLIRMLVDAAQAQRRVAHQQLFQELETPALTTLVLSLAIWIEEAAFPQGAGQAVSLSHAAPELLDRLARKAGRKGRHIGELSPDERHDLRKALKKLRYGVTYFSALYPSRVVETYVRRCRALLRHLGENNDATVAATLIHTLGAAHLKLAPVAGIFARWNDKRQRHALHALVSAWKVFRDTRPFWR
ncbi:CYTH and CHAD domain-containing protein [Komagataeibacter swingsii]|uniref:Inorganic triphosphatase n=1 Tax=Komagataeibacter swingsii TaxID=215220 RepID=A0A2V4R800_9PROT|nr:CHAD domain-containing protein [Komagataeibacter swingsii]PYD70958.1 hypothetical protein CFR76_03340 [Komagataeibacter swingsii]GBQ56902.1 hypothetical protein AA16373_0858 [Komagataeibacter swingsii DSM 16373]